MVTAFKLLYQYILIDIESLPISGLTRKEKEKLVVKLYKQDMTYAQIAKEAHVSLRDIGPILNRAGEYQSLSHSSQAYKMFSEGSTPIQVAITLNLREKDVNEYYREYWILNAMYCLYQIYEEIKDDIWSVVELSRQMKAAGKNIAHAIRLLEISNNYIPSIEHRIRELEREETTLNIRIQQAAKTFQEFNDSILNEKKTLEQYQMETRQVKQELGHLNMEKIKLENFIEFFHNSDEAYLKIKQIVKHEIEHIMAIPVRQLLSFALASIFESSRRHPEKLRSLYYNMSTAEIESMLRTSIGHKDHNPSQDEKNEDTPEKILLEEAEQVFSKLIEKITGKCVNEIPKYIESVSQTEQVSGLQYDSSHLGRGGGVRRL